MRWRSFVLVLVLVLVPSGAVRAQSAVPVEADPTEAKEQRLEVAEQVVSEVPGLRLAENRAYALARAGQLICKDDKKTAEGHFQRAVNELASAQLAAEAEERGRPSPAETQLTRTVRPNVLTWFGNCNAEAALDALYRTRTPGILRDLAAVPGPGRGESNDSGLTLAAQTEIALEQRLIGLAAEQNPETAVKVIQDSIRKGLTGETLGLLKRLYKKDPEAAAALAKDAMDRLLSSSFSPGPDDRNEVNFASAILSDHIRPVRPGMRDLRFDDAQVRSLAARYINYRISQQSRSRANGNLQEVIRIAEKLSPGHLAALRRLQQTRRPQSQRLGAEARRPTSSNAPAAQTAAGASRLPTNERGRVYQSAAERMAVTGDMTGAMALLSQNYSGRALENAISSLNRRYAEALISQGRWQEAESAIDQVADDAFRRRTLTELARKAFAKDPVENKEIAANFLRKARSMLSQRPVDSDSTQSFVQLALAYAPIEPDEAFSLMEATVPVLNDLADATAYVSAFRSENLVRQGEFTLYPMPSYGFQVDPAVWRSLMKADKERTSTLIERFARREIRIAIRFQIAGEPAR